MKVQEEQFTKGFDFQLIKRLSAYLKPYIAPALFALFALILSTVAELYNPIIVQRTIDQNLIAVHLLYRSGKATPEDQAHMEPVLAKKGNREIDGETFIPLNNLGQVSGTIKKQLEQRGLLDTTEYYIIFPEEGSSLPKDVVDVIHRYPELFSIVGDSELMDKEGPLSVDSDNSGAGYKIKVSQLKSISRDDLKILRQEDRRGIAVYAWIFLGLLVVGLITTFIQVYVMAELGQNVMRDIRTDLLRHLIDQSLSYLQRTPVGSLVSRLTSDVDTINELFTSVAISFIKDISLMGGVIIALFFLNTRLAVITLLTMPPVLVATMFFRVKARDAYRQVRSWTSRLNAFLSEHISGMDVVQMFGREKISRDEFQESNRGMLKAQLSEMYVFAAFRPLIDLFTSISIGVVLYYGARMFTELSVSLGILIAFINLIQKFYRPVMDISEKFTIMQSAMAGGERLFAILDTDSRIPDTGKDIDPSTVRGEIQFDNVHFAYNPGEPVLKDLSFRVTAGETIAVVGYTGAGKTTIANLLTRFWDIQEGEILVDGRPVADYSLPSLRKIIQPVQQDVFLFSGTIHDNIALGSGISREGVINAAKTVHAHSFIEKMTEGYDTMVQERGSNLSTGQKQLISFARVIAHDPKILILDEATGSIDTETEKLVQQALDILLQGRTSLVIAHRLSTIQHADRIFALSGGKLVEDGSHDELMKKKGLYYNLYKLQYQQ